MQDQNNALLYTAKITLGHVQYWRKNTLKLRNFRCSNYYFTSNTSYCHGSISVLNLPSVFFFCSPWRLTWPSITNYPKFKTHPPQKLSSQPSPAVFAISCNSSCKTNSSACFVLVVLQRKNTGRSARSCTGVLRLLSLKRTIILSAMWYMSSPWTV
jgi:hypothetical protein